MLCEVARGVRHLLMRGGDRKTGRVVVRAEVCAGHASAAGGDKMGEGDPAIGGKDRLRRLHHQFNGERTTREPSRSFEFVARGASADT